ncbi:MAG: hypothetical protein M5U29_03365 [Anaerolineae bacterium]|nr:hypothetical protein [Anaerolineae bacterium]
MKGNDMPLHAIATAAPGLGDSLNRLPALADPDPLWDMLRRLMAAHAPSGGANLPGGIGGEIAALAGELGLGDRVIPALGSTGNAALWLGADTVAPDVVVVAHMDRPSFRVGNPDDGALFAICANRFPPGDYRTPAKASALCGWAAGRRGGRDARLAESRWGSGAPFRGIARGAGLGRYRADRPAAHP